MKTEAQLIRGRESARRYRLEHPEYARQYRDRNREIFRSSSRASSANKRARQYGAPGTITIHDVRKVLSVGACAYCGSRNEITVDHVIPLNEGGPNSIENLVPACRPCNISKWRGERPWKWSRTVDACLRCGTSERRHWCYGLCRRCYHAVNAPERRIHWNAKVTKAGVAEIRQRHANGETRAALAGVFGLAWQTVDDIIQRRTWKHVPDSVGAVPPIPFGAARQGVEG